MKFKAGFFDGWLLALFVAVLISGITVFILSKTHSFAVVDILPAGVTVFWSSFLIVLAFLELVVLREAKRIIQLTRKMKKKKESDSEVLVVERPGLFNPMRRMYEEVFTFTTNKELEIETLTKAENFRKEFVANVSHELKTPLFAAQGFIHTLVDGADKDEKVRRNFLNKAAKSLDDLDELVQDILKLSQLEAGEIRMKLEPLDMEALVLKIEEKFKSLAAKKSISLRVHKSKVRPLVLADSKWIAQVVSNLVSNAINYSPEGSEVEVQFKVSRKQVITVVEDHGEGIAPVHLNRIFERFYRVDKSRSKEHGGTGLGLAIVKHILELHHSRAEVSSDPGKGSVFSFALSRVKED
jgi:two-component system phosphate regulon sensor histidine kinase PhoR